jgi:hypothetical protein
MISFILSVINSSTTLGNSKENRDSSAIVQINSTKFSGEGQILGQSTKRKNLQKMLLQKSSSQSEPKR